MNKLVIAVAISLVILSGATATWFLYSSVKAKHSVADSSALPVPSVQVQTDTVPTPIPTQQIIEAPKAMVADFPQFPVYPGAEIVKSSQRAKAINTGKDLVAEWKVQGSVIEIMQWYIPRLQEQGWTVEPPNDPQAAAEQVAHLKKDNLSGYIGIEYSEDNQDVVEIVASFQKLQ